MSVATFQSTVSAAQGFGVVGELFDSGPRRAEPFILTSASAAYNVFGRGFSITGDGIAAAGNTGNAIFAGILINPKSQVSFGDGVDPLNPTLTLPNYITAELLTFGCIVVAVPAACAIGDIVIYDGTTGALSTLTPGSTIPGGKFSAFAVVDRFTPNAAGLAVIRVGATP